MTQSISTNTFGVAKWVVSADATQGTHTTIAAATTSAASGDTIYIRDGAYTENITGKAGLNYIGESLTGVTIIGKITLAVAGTITFQSISFITNSDNIASLAGSSASAIGFFNCGFSPTNATGIVINNNIAGSGITIYHCGCSCTNGFSLFTLTTGLLLIEKFTSAQTAALSSTASTMAAGTLQIRDSYLSVPLTCSGGTVILDGITIDQAALNTTALTVSGATVTSYDCVYRSGSASAINVSSGTLNSYNDIVESSNTNAVTGAGTINYSGMIFAGTSALINTTTQAGGIAKGGQNGVAPASGYIGEVISGTFAVAQVMATGTLYNLGSISLTKGEWNITANAVWSPTGVNSTNVNLYAAISLANNNLTPIDGTYGNAAGFLGGTGIVNFTGAATALKLGASTVNISTTTSYYLNVEMIAAVACNATTNGYMIATRVG